MFGLFRIQNADIVGLRAAADIKVNNPHKMSEISVVVSQQPRRRGSHAHGCGFMAWRPNTNLVI
jgi:hypothetical protein